MHCKHESLKLALCISFSATSDYWLSGVIGNQGLHNKTFWKICWGDSASMPGKMKVSTHLSMISKITSKETKGCFSTNALTTWCSTQFPKGKHHRKSFLRSSVQEEAWWHSEYHKVYCTLVSCRAFMTNSLNSFCSAHFSHTSVSFCLPTLAVSL